MPVNSSYFYKYIGHVPYAESMKMQQEIHETVLKGNQFFDGCILALSHEPVITFGKYSKESNLLVDEKILEHDGVNLYRSTRGGDVTCHEPGQLVVYPVLNLKKLGIGVKAYVKLLEDTICSFLRKSGISGETLDGRPGVWVDNKKIASVGINISRHVTSHGVALNISNSLKTFAYVNPCGFPGMEMTSVLIEKGECSDLKTSANDFIRNFSEIFGVAVQEYPDYLYDSDGAGWKMPAA